MNIWHSRKRGRLPHWLGASAGAIGVISVITAAVLTSFTFALAVPTTASANDACETFPQPPECSQENILLAKAQDALEAALLCANQGIGCERVDEGFDDPTPYADFALPRSEIPLDGEGGWIDKPFDEPDPPADFPEAAVAAAAPPSAEITSLLEQEKGVEANAAARARFACAINSLSPRKISGRRVQGRAINICSGPVTSVSVTACVSYFGRDRIWHGSDCGVKPGLGPGTLDYRITGPCVSGLRFWRTESFGSAVVNGIRYVSRVDKSKQVPIRC